MWHSGSSQEKVFNENLCKPFRSYVLIPTIKSIRSSNLFLNKLVSGYLLEKLGFLLFLMTVKLNVCKKGVRSDVIASIPPVFGILLLTWSDESFKFSRKFFCLSNYFTNDASTSLGKQESSKCLILSEFTTKVYISLEK